ncbi:aminotransferase class I/II-fold pyridoxal phosphate-dependent enzyme [Pseudoprevotella muciniphila]|uniref:Aminotransferase n=1 Tax=Pseudoprevotella muciniphila TaxID=2133944 RepID=A0A5P8E6Z7_9BACT|nr:aminotransferase class I/II-fold pyridoxal phosphate-dependent enzyme [Pseudoprevotella muciniphila]QFQ12795.1 aminotransferase class I/II-fold pyridoxal phosphate-dependent enzyme [Pseudoprevotella muciniphila]
MQAIILAAGMGRRLGELTQNNTKCMISVNKVTLIDRMLTQLSRLDLSRVVIVVGYKGAELKSFIGMRYDRQLKIEYVENPIYDKTNNIYSLALAKEQLQEDDTLLIESDLIVEDSLFDLILNDEHPNIALVAKYQTWMDGTMVCINDDLNIVNFVPKKAFKYDDTDHYYKTVNIYKFSKSFSRNKYVPFLEAYSKALGNNEYYEQVLRVITFLDNTDLKALPIGERKWYEIDDIQDLDIAETIFASKEQMMERYNKRYGGHWRFPKLLDYCYLVNPYFPTKRMKDEIRANFDTLLTQYPSGMYVNSLLAAKYVNVRQDYIVVGNGAAELIKSLMENTKGNVGVVYPTFEEYPNRSCDGENKIVAYIPEAEDFSYCADDLKSFFADKNLSMLLLINPDNPSGNFIPKADVIQLAEWCKEKHIRLVVDESFVDFSDDFRNNSLYDNDILDNNHNLIVVKSISKSYGVPGLRLGFLASADTDLIQRMKKDVAIWNINSFAEFYMQIFGKYTMDYDAACRKFISERCRFRERLEKVPFIRVLPSQANYFLIEITEKYTSTQLTQILLEKYDILVKDGKSKKSLQNRNFIRIAIRDSKDNDKLVDALMEL